MTIPNGSSALMDALTELSSKTDQIARLAGEIAAQWDSKAMVEDLPVMIAVAMRGRGVHIDGANLTESNLKRYFTIIRGNVRDIVTSASTIDRTQEAATEVLDQAVRVAAAVDNAEIFKI